MLVIRIIKNCEENENVITVTNGKKGPPFRLKSMKPYWQSKIKNNICDLSSEKNRGIYILRYGRFDINYKKKFAAQEVLTVLVAEKTGKFRRLERNFKSLIELFENKERSIFV